MRERPTMRKATNASDSTTTTDAPLDLLLTNFRSRHHLSTREAEIVRAAARGLCTKETAAEMDCSPKTIDELWRRVYRKIGCDSRLAVVAQLLASALDGAVPAHATPPGRAALTTIAARNT